MAIIFPQRCKVADNFYEGLFNVANDALKNATIRIRELEKANGELQLTLASNVPTLSKMQDRITELELQLNESGRAAEAWMLEQGKEKVK